VIHSICPALGVGLIGTDRTNVVRFSVIVPCDYLEHVDLVSHGNDLFHSRSEEPVVASINPVLVVAVDTVVLLVSVVSSGSNKRGRGTYGKESRRHGRHVSLCPQSRHILIVRSRSEWSSSHGPSTIPVKLSIQPIKILESTRVREDSRHEVNRHTLIGHECLCIGPSGADAGLTEITVLSCESRDEDFVLVSCLSGRVCVGRDNTGQVVGVGHCRAAE
jgi:hypothetical protein